MKKIMLLFVIALITISTAMAGTTSVSSNSTTTTGTESFTATITINETATGNIYVYKGSIGGTLVYSESATANATTHTYKINSDKDSDIVGGTTYYIEMNGTGEAGTGAYSAINSATTTAYTITNSAARTLIGLFSFLIVGAAGIYYVMQPQNITSTKKIIMILALTIIGALVIKELTTAVLGI